MSLFPTCPSCAGPLGSCRCISKPAETINGWTPPVIYDIREDRFRIATQADLDKYMALTRVYGKVITLAKDLLAEHEAFTKSMQEKYGK